MRSLSFQGARVSLTHPALPQMSTENNNTNNSFALKSILENEKLDNTNFLSWQCNLRIVLKMAKKLYVLDAPVPEAPDGNTAAARKA
ncbi:hypothetical protein L1987_13712 [Smallanthus sonchifolius]|uniref:Uncharacterized protein n=1 Tax=Smallanthus sonchifolius TaxID=185202 RepID=A0ACB9JK01_9ASTR|nr:hypothetical protein L1987_13712 [Smallanthus sonchifolius]